MVIVGAYTVERHSGTGRRDGVRSCSRWSLVKVDRRATFTVVLDTQPTADVAIPVSSSNPGEGIVSTASLLFTSDNWNVPQSVSVTGVADGIARWRRQLCDRYWSTYKR